MTKTTAACGKREHPSRFPIVGVGASAGGLEAFTQLLNRLPTDTGIGFVLVQHLDPTHDSELTRLLARATSMPTREVTNNLRVEPNHIYVIPPNVNLSILKGVLKLQPRPEGRRPHHAIDFFLESLAQDQAERAIGVILSGTATDGTLGLEAIKAEGGITFAQDESAKYDSMPRSAVAAGCVDFVLSPEGIANELARIAKHPYVMATQAELDIAAAETASVASGSGTDGPVEKERSDVTGHEDDTSALPSGGHGTPDDGAERARAEAQRGPAPADEKDLKSVLLLLRNHSGVDFSLYKSTTIERRIARRIVLNQHTTFADYAKFLRGNVKELDTLFSDVLISVTSFFRNPEAFDALKRVVFPKLVRARRIDPLRVWILGCSTGQEAYSIGMAYSEFAEDVARAPKLQIFATDLNEALLDKARAGLYAATLAADLSPERLRRFFVEEEGGYRVIKPLREMVVFARQNLISDPPFSRIDLISCRNLLIYLEPAIQKKALPTFHYALRPDGFLLLGASESVGQFTDLFQSVDRKQKLFSRKSVATPPHHMPAARRAPAVTGKGAIRSLPTIPDTMHTELTAQREADRVAVKEFAPPGVLVNAEWHIVQFRGPTSAYLTPPSGAASFDVLKMAREGLMLPLRAALNKAKREQKAVRTENARVGQNGATRAVNLQVIPLKNLKERCYLILFEDAGKRGDGNDEGGARARAARAPAETAAAPGDGRGDAPTMRQRLKALERELAETRDYLQSLQEQHDAAHEALQASNEEVESANEELQSVNEELETSKEELESSNEELTTINDEMSQRNAELNRLNADLNNLNVSIDTGILVLGRDLTIRRFTPPAAKLLNLLATDVGRALSGIRDNLSVPALPGTRRGAARPTKRRTMPRAASERPLDLQKLAQEVIETAGVRECEVQDRQGRWYALRVRPYMTLDNRIDGAVVVIMDIDALKRSEQATEAARNYAESIIRTLRDPLLVLRSDLRVHMANEAFYQTFGVKPQTTEGHLVYELGNGQWNIPGLRTLLEEILPRNNYFNDLEVTHQFPALGRRTMLLNARRLDTGVDARESVVLVIEDISERKRAEEALRESDQHKDEFLAMLAHELRNPLTPIRNAVQILRRTGGDSRQGKLAIEMIERQLGQVVRLVDDLLDVGRISQGKIELRAERSELASIVNDVVEAARSNCESAGNALAVALPSKPLYVNGDPTRLAQVVDNLLNNACKFTERGGRIDLILERDGTQAIIRVRDTGIGIGADLLPRVFDLFMQADTSLGRSQGGLGIGLTLVKRLVELHDGTVEAHSDGLGRGTEIVVRLPISTKSVPAAPQASSASPPATPVSRRILIVDDNPDIVDSLAMLLTFAGHDVHIAHDGLAAVNTAAELRPDIVFLDIGLPKLDGYEAARRIRQQQGDKRSLLVALTGWGGDEEKHLSAQAGFDLHMVKPVELGAIETLLASLPVPPG